MAGDDPRSLEKTAAKLKLVGIRLMVLPSMEEDVGENQNQLKYDQHYFSIYFCKQLKVFLFFFN